MTTRTSTTSLWSTSVWAGPGEPYATGCMRGDHVGDQDIDLRDLQRFLNGYEPGE